MCDFEVTIQTITDKSYYYTNTQDLPAHITTDEAKYVWHVCSSPYLLAQKNYLLLSGKG